MCDFCQRRGSGTDVQPTKTFVFGTVPSKASRAAFGVSRIEHAQHLSGRAAIESFAAGSVWAVTNPLHLPLDSRVLVERLGEERAGPQHAYPLNSLLRVSLLRGLTRRTDAVAFLLGMHCRTFSSCLAAAHRIFESSDVRGREQAGKQVSTGASCTRAVVPFSLAPLNWPQNHGRPIHLPSQSAWPGASAAASLNPAGSSWSYVACAL
jgi:hypothetical protein